MATIDADRAGRRDVRAGRLTQEAYLDAFSDAHPPLDRHEAFVEADRCYFCHDAPCVTACPTGIDIPLFIRQIQTDNAKGAAKTIFDSNIFGGTCARVCPVENLCEGACVREMAEGKPVKIGLLQRHATDTRMDGPHPYRRAPSTGRRVAVVGAGPAGLACAHRLALHGHDVNVFEARDKPGGLNEYGIAAYKLPDHFAQREVDFILGIGGIRVETGMALGRDFSLVDLRRDYDAVFLGMGLSGVNALGLEGEGADGVGDAVSYIAALRQAEDLSTLEVGRRVVVIGGGMTAIDIATQSKKLGADEVTIVYRRGEERMGASRHEREFARSHGVVIRTHAAPTRLVLGEDGATAIVFSRTADGPDGLEETGETFELPADMIFKAIGQTFLAAPLEGLPETIALERGRIRVDAERRTSLDGVWAGGDCIKGGEDLTVAAVEDGKRAAESMHRALAPQPVA